MGDSDDERDFRRRDKFHNERRGYDGGERFVGGDWGREPRTLPPPSYGYRGRPSSYGGDFRRDRYSPDRRRDMSPPPKRMRGGWEDDRGYGMSYDRGDYDREYDRPPPPSRSHSSSRHKQKVEEDLEGYQPLMMSFKAFMQTQDDSISDEEGIKKYAEYKLEFKRQQLNEFFVNHKDEEWFKQKYHPEESIKRKEELKAMLVKRVEVFQEFVDSGKFDGLSLDGDKQDALIKVLDSVVIKLEGGTDFDLATLDLPDEDDDRRDDEDFRSHDRDKRDKKRKKTRDSSREPEESSSSSRKSKEQVEPEKSKSDGSPRKRKRSESQEKEEIKEDKSKDEKEEEEKEDKVKQDDEKEEEKEKELEVNKESAEKADDAEKEMDTSDSKEEPDVGEKEKEEAKEEKDQEEEEKKDQEDEKPEEGEEEAEKKVPEKRRRRNRDDDDDDDDESLSEDEEMTKKSSDEKSSKPRALHKTFSIFLRNLAPTITKQEVEAMCKRYDGFLRAAIADPAPDRRWFRRGWVTFRRDVKIKEICFNLNNIRLRDCELGPIVNRDLTRRVRTVSGLTCDKKVVRNDIKLAAKIINNLDNKWGLWQPDGKQDVLGLASANPLLANITDYLIEEASAEEEELLGRKDGDGEDGGESDGYNIVRDEDLIKVLDKMILYLRIVHSVDFYNHSEYPNEDEMPNRCGILHARGLPPGAKVSATEIEEYMASFEKKMGGFLTPRQDLSDEEAMKLGLKNEEDEVEKFVAANTQELAKDKWLCPLSGKKFKGPEFVRKHIFNKHGEKVEEVKKEVRFYNAYLKDPKRPQLPEHPNSKPGARGSSSSSGAGGGPRGGDPYEYSGPNRDATKYPVFGDRGAHYDNRAYEHRGYRQAPPRRDPYLPMPPRSRGGMDPFGGRPIITYRDWDAPNDDYL